LTSHAGKVALIVLTRSAASQDAMASDERIAEQLRSAMENARENSHDLSRWTIEKVTVLDDP
jgi:hypothetical protein